MLEQHACAIRASTHAHSHHLPVGAAWSGAMESSWGYKRGLVLFVELDRHGVRSSPAEMKAQNWQLLTGAIILSLAVIVQCQGRSRILY